MIIRNRSFNATWCIPKAKSKNYPAINIRKVDAEPEFIRYLEAEKKAREEAILHRGGHGGFAL